MPEVRYYGLGLSAPKKATPELPSPKEKSRPHKKEPKTTLQEEISLPSLRESLGADSAYIVQMLEEISSSVDTLSEKVTTLINNQPVADATEKERK